MCSLSVLFSYKVGLFNIGAAGQYVVGVGACLYCALAFHLPWYVCLLAGNGNGHIVVGEQLVEPQRGEHRTGAGFYYPSAAARIKYFGSTLVKTAPLLMCSLSVLFSYKVGMEEMTSFTLR